MRRRVLPVALGLTLAALGAVVLGVRPSHVPPSQVTVGRSPTAVAPPGIELPRREPAATGHPARSPELAGSPARPDAITRAREFLTVAREGTPESAAWLADAAGTNDGLGALAAAALGSIADHRAVPELARLAVDDGLVIVRANAIRALARSGGREHAGDLGVLVRDPSQPARVRQEAALALADLGDDGVVSDLVAELARDASPQAEQLRIAIVQALGAIGTESARVALGRHATRQLSALERLFTERAIARSVHGPARGVSDDHHPGRSGVSGAPPPAPQGASIGVDVGARA